MCVYIKKEVHTKTVETGKPLWITEKGEGKLDGGEVAQGKAHFGVWLKSKREKNYFFEN